jgi:DNA polymerase-3 subunit epsilon
MTQYKKLVFIDLETTGANPAVDRITEIGIVEVGADDQVTRWSTLVNPQMPIPPFIQNLTGISNEMVEHAPTFDALLDELRIRLEGGLFIAHNARFDYGFLRNAFKQSGHTLRCEVLCTVKLSRALFPDETRHNLDVLIARHGLTAQARHRALADADLLWQLWNKLQATLPAKTFDRAVRALLQRPSLPSHLSQDALDDLPDTPGVYMFYGENDVPLYVGKSNRLRPRVLSHFNADPRLHKDMPLPHQIHRLDWRETAGEVGALLLEAKLIKDLRPLHNRVSRRKNELCAWQLRPDASGAMRPVLTFAAEQNFARAERLYGLYASKRKAEAALRELAERNRLCLVTLGLESRSQEITSCSAHPSQRCGAACIGEEPIALHQARLEAALAGLHVKTWPYPGAIALIETVSDSREEMHVVHNWRYLGTARSEAALWSLLGDAPTSPAFDLDTYKIVTRALAHGRLRVQMLTDKKQTSTDMMHAGEIGVP